MAEGKRQIVIGGRYRHPDRFGTEYVVDSVVPDATGEEETGQLGQSVLYTQVVAGIYPVGTEYTRSLADFLGQTEYDGEVVNKFELVPDQRE